MTFPKGTDLSRWSAEELEAVAHALYTRPRKTLGWKTPAEAFNETWIERTYHRPRRQRALGRLTPIESEAIMTTPAASAA